MPHAFQYNMVTNLEWRDSSFYTPLRQPVLMPPMPTPLMARPISGLGLPRELRPLSSGDWAYKTSLHVRKPRTAYSRQPFSGRSPSQMVLQFGNQSLPQLPPLVPTSK